MLYFIKSKLKRRDQDHLHPKLQVPRLTYLGRESNPWPLQEHLLVHMSAWPIEIACDKTFVFVRIFRLSTVRRNRIKNEKITINFKAKFNGCFYENMFKSCFHCSEYNYSFLPAVYIFVCAWLRGYMPYRAATLFIISFICNIWTQGRNKKRFIMEKKVICIG